MQILAEEKCIPIASLEPKLHEWCIRVLVAEKTPVRTLQSGKTQLKLVFIDDEHTKIKCIVFHPDAPDLDEVLKLYKTYYIGNGKIIPLNRNFPIMVDYKYQMIFNRSANIKATEKEEELPLDNVYQLTPFAQFPDFMGSSEDKVDKSLFFVL
ncbi:OLC1v1024799C1 [Oldenlandia corymbosa var. corymbosa]|uniref:OLC1v1024799C1 n=1 Tax=Oldenlandia corymbosa var. corymbosa TaxID=529605 RepID=A0AAV1C4K7_OLDCO|nr:OLC1v1024799C1 [Oldenlandia corymbosa var. corymbosa]